MGHVGGWNAQVAEMLVILRCFTASTQRWSLDNWTEECGVDKWHPYDRCKCQSCRHAGPQAQRLGKLAWACPTPGVMPSTLSFCGTLHIILNIALFRQSQPPSLFSRFSLPDRKVKCEYMKIIYTNLSGYFKSIMPTFFHNVRDLGMCTEDPLSRPGYWGSSLFRF